MRREGADSWRRVASPYLCGLDAMTCGVDISIVRGAGFLAIATVLAAAAAVGCAPSSDPDPGGRRAHALLRDALITQHPVPPAATVDYVSHSFPAGWPFTDGHSCWLPLDAFLSFRDTTDSRASVTAFYQAWAVRAGWVPLAPFPPTDRAWLGIWHKTLGPGVNATLTLAPPIPSVSAAYQLAAGVEPANGGCDSDPTQFPAP